jgi:hypothetical protein
MEKKKFNGGAPFNRHVSVCVCVCVPIAFSLLFAVLTQIPVFQSSVCIVCLHIPAMAADDRWETDPFDDGSSSTSIMLTYLYRKVQTSAHR